MHDETQIHFQTASSNIVTKQRKPNNPLFINYSNNILELLYSESLIKI